MNRDPRQPDLNTPSSRRAVEIARQFTPRNLLSSPTLRATGWVSRYSISIPSVTEDRIETGHGFGRLAIHGDAIWVTNAASKTAARIDRRSGRVANLAELRRTPVAITVGTRAIWVACGNGWLWRFQPNGDGEGMARLEDRVRGLACDRESVWVLHANGELVSVDQETGEITMKKKIRRGGRQLLFANGVLVALSANGSRVFRVAPGSGAVEAEGKLPARGVRMAVHDGTLWVACGRRLASRWGALVPVDLATMEAGPPRKLLSAPRAITAGAGYVWAACGRRGERKSSIVRMEPEPGDFTLWAETDWTIYDLAVAEDQLLAATGLTLAGPTDGGAAGIGVGHHGGHDGGGGGGEGGGGGQ
jgi:hypothetical protein